VDQLNASPAQVKIFASDAERTVKVVMVAYSIDVLFLGMYNPFVTASLPRMIYAIRQGDFTFLEDRLALYFDTSRPWG
jgi:hypothetical protein